MNETHVIGPPGCGKTTWLSRQVERAVEKYGADRVMVASFTKSAVAELNRRELPIPKEQIGTLHAMAFHALNRPKIAETGPLMKEFSEAHPSFEITDATRDGIEDGYAQGGKSEGSKLLQEYSRLRALMRPRDLWPARVSDFAGAWEHFKNDIHARDFSDLIEDCVKEEISPGCDAAAWFLDEVQDFTPLELSLVRLWGRNLEKMIMVGDADQCIYSFKGAQADLGMNPDAHVMTLKTSYRVSQAVHEFSERVINLIPAEQRLQREYLPTDEPGEVVNMAGNYKRPEAWIDVVQKHLDRYETVMILASCSYMVSPVVDYLRREGIPFANSYRRKRRDWNPLVQSKRDVTAAMRVTAYLAGWRRDPVNWTGLELGRWLPLGAGILKRGGRDKIDKATTPDAEAPLDLLREVLPWEEMLAAGPGWIMNHLSASHRRVDYHLRVGMKAWEDLETEPALLVGTYHSVKGGEADCVIAFPDLSPEAARAVRHGDIGPTARMMFVGATRARTSLYLGQASNSGFALRWP